MTEKKTQSKRKVLLRVTRVAVVAIAIVALFCKQDFGEVWNNFLLINPWSVTFAFFCFLICQFVTALRWWLLLNLQSVSIGYRSIVKLHFLSLFYSNILPSMVGGDPLKIWYLLHHTEQKWPAAISVFVDRVVGLACTILIIILATILFFGQKGYPGISTLLPDLYGSNFEINEQKTVVCFLILILAVPSIIVAYLLVKNVIKKHFKSAFLELKTAARIYRSRPWRIIQACGLTLFCHCLSILSYYVIGQCLRIEASITTYFIFFPISCLLGALPISPGGAGIVEGGLVLLFCSLPDVSKEQALILALSQRLVWVAGSLPGALTHLLGKHLPSQNDLSKRDTLPNS